MRIGVSLIFHNSMFFQSFGLGSYKVLGRPETVLEAIDYHGFSEVLLIRPSISPVADRLGSEKNFQDLYCTIPLIVSGQLNLLNCEDDSIERYSFNSSLFNDKEKLDSYRNRFGRQAIVGIIPFIRTKTGHKFVDISNDRKYEITSELIESFYRQCDEIILHDIEAHGSSCGFDFMIFDIDGFSLSRTIICGGVTNQDVIRSRRLGIAAVYYDNVALHSEKLIYDYVR